MTLSLRLAALLAITSALASGTALAQANATASQAIADAVWAAVQPALPYPAANDDDTPVDGRADVQWVVRRLDGEDGRMLEAIANPLNAENQSRAAKAMAEIQASVTEAERRAQADYERKLGTTSRRNPTREVVGITLDDEGVAGERADWTAKLMVEAHAGAAPERWQPPGPGSPERAIVGRAVVLSIGEAEYDETGGDGPRRRYRPAESRLYFGSIEVVLRGNRVLVDQVRAKSDWTRVAALAP